MNDFLTFKRMITPIIIQVLFWVGVAVCVVGGLLQLGQQPIAGVLLLLLGPVMVRVYCEILIVFFKILESLYDLNKKVAGGSSMTPPQV
jgi:hypothetical protein